MNETERQDLEKEVKRAKRIASDKAGALHDLVEDRLPGAYKELPAVAQACFEACEAWAALRTRLERAQNEAAGA